MFGSKLTGANQREGDGKGVALGRETGGGGQGTFWLSGAIFSVTRIPSPKNRLSSPLFFFKEMDIFTSRFDEQ